MHKKSLLALTLTALTLVPLACTIESTKSDETGGRGGSDDAGGAKNSGGTAAKGGNTAVGGKSDGGTTAAGGSSTSGAGGSAGNTVAGATNAGGGTSVAGSAGLAASGGVTTAGGTSTVAGATNVAGAAGSSATPSRTRVDVTDSIETATIWTADHVYVIPSGATVYVSATLTIQPGTIIKFGAGSRLYIQPEGQLNAVGTSAAHIVFTGIKDDVGGDTNGDGSASQPSLGDWVTVEVMANASAFDYIELRYSTAGLGLNGANQSIKHSTLTFNAVALDASAAEPPASTIITDNVFYGNTRPIKIDAGTPVDATNVFHNPSAATQVNTFQGIEVMTNISTSVTWSNIEVAYVLPSANASYYVSSPAALTLAAGVVVKVAPGSTIIVSSGASLNQTPTTVFTSYKDDTKLGDSNGDGTATAAAAGDWDGVRVITPTTDDWLTGTNLLYALN